MVSPPLFISDVRILDFSGPSAVATPHMTVLITDGRIAAVGADGQVAAPAGALRIDGRGRTLMPGLVDMHVHIWDQASLGAYLAHGVTTVRNASGMPFHLRLRDEIAAGRLAGPRVITTGPILNSPGANAQVFQQMVVTADEARAAVRAQHAAGYRRIKVYSNLTREAYEAIRDEAAALDMTVMGHTPEGVRGLGVPHEKPFNIAFDELLDDHFVTFEHMESIVWHGLRDRHDEAAARALARRVADSGTPVDPTLVAFANLVHVAETRGAYLERPGVDTLNPVVVAQTQAQYERWTNEAIEPNRNALAFYQKATRIFADEGVLMVAGSDSGIFTNTPGQSLIDELDLLHGAGLTPAEVLKMATVNPAIVLAEDDHVGRVATGYRADLILLAEDPLGDVTAAGRPDAVIAGGRCYDAAALEALQDGASRPDVQRTIQNVSEGLIAVGVDPAPLLGG